MAATKSLTTIQASASNAAGGTTTSSTANLTTSYGSVITARVTNGATGPTVACTVTVNISGDGTNWRQFAQQNAALGNNVVTDCAFELPPAAMYAQVVFNGNTVQPVTVEALIETLLTI